MTLERGEIAGAVIGDAVLPATPQDADPFEGQNAQGGLAMLLSGPDLGHVVCSAGVADSLGDWGVEIVTQI